MTGAVVDYFQPDQIGEYHIQAIYPGQVLNGENPDTGATGQNMHMVGSRLLESESEVVTLVVQEDDVGANYQSPGLPDEYWTRPIYSTNWAWGEHLGSNWFGLMAPSFMTTGGYDATGNVQPYGTAPNTAHIMWSKPTHFGGQPGAPIPSDQSTQFSSTSVVINYFEPIIMSGVLYYTQFASLSTEIVGWEAVDIRTGETLWTRSAGETGTEKMLMGQIARYHSVQEFGSMAYIYSAPLAGFFSAPSWLGMYDAYTGVLVGNVTNIGAIAGWLGGTQPFLMDVDDTDQIGTLLCHYTSGNTLYMWNSSKMLGTRPGGTYDFEDGIQWSVEMPAELKGVELSLSIDSKTPEVLLLRQTETLIQWQEANSGWQVTAGMDTKTGELLWGPINQTLPALQDISVVAARDGYYILHNKDANEAYGFSLTTGKQLWGPVEMEGNAWSTTGRGGEIAYGKAYIFDNGGFVHAFDLETGHIDWVYTRGSAKYDNPFGVYPIFHYSMHSVADGKLFLSEGYLYTPPLHPARRLAINCSDGELVWSILSYSSRSPGAIADGYFVQWNSFDNKIYSFGKGPTELAVTASPKVSVANSAVLIEGTIMDISAGSEQDGVIERFSNGLPVVSDDCMSEWMEYLYMQQMRPDNITGVPVKLAYQLPDGTWKDIDQVMSDEYGNFGFRWTPPEEGTYVVKAFFLGSESYWGSSSVTYLTVSSSAASGPTAEEIADATVNKLPAYPTVPEIPAYLTIDIVILLIAIVGVVIGLIAYMALRKQK
jgi:hypothetical protein